MSLNLNLIWCLISIPNTCLRNLLFSYVGVTQKKIAQLCKTRNNMDERYPTYGLATNTHSSIIGIKLFCEFFYVLYPCYTTCSILKRDHFTAMCTFGLTWGPTGLHAKRWQPNEDQSNYYGMAVVVLQVNMMHHDRHESDVSSFHPECALENNCSASSNSG